MARIKELEQYYNQYPILQDAGGMCAAFVVDKVSGLSYGQWMID